MTGTTVARCPNTKDRKHRPFTMEEERFDVSGDTEALFSCVICDKCGVMLEPWRPIPHSPS